MWRRHPGLQNPRAFAKHSGKTENVRVRELISRIENHPHRDELKADLRQDNVCNAFSKNSKKMIHDTGNVEYFELCETTSKVQCSYCLSCWTKGIVYCTCGICLCRTEAIRRLNRKRIDFELRDLKGMPSRSSSWKVWAADQRSPGLQRMETMAMKKMPQVKISQEVKTGSWRIRSTVNRKKNMDGIKQSVKRWTNWDKNITLTHLRGPNSCGIHQIGASS